MGMGMGMGMGDRCNSFCKKGVSRALCMQMGNEEHEKARMIVMLRLGTYCNTGFLVMR